MTNNSTASTTVSDQCEWAQFAGDIAFFVTYKIISPIHLFVGLFANALCIIPFYRKAKHDAPFAYQLILTAAQILEITFFAIYVLTLYWWPGAEWFDTCYVCVYYAAHMADPIGNMFLTNSLMLTLATAIDRVIALWKPFKYKSMDHKKHQVVSCIASILISVGITVFDCFRTYAKLSEDGRTYSVAVNVEFVQSATAEGMALLRDSVRITATVLLVITNAIMIVLYRRQVVNKIRSIASKKGSAEVKRKRAQEKLLTLLAISESTFNFLSMSILATYYTMVYAVPSFFACRHLYAPLTDGMVEVLAACDFYIVFAISKQFRTMIIEGMPAWVKKLTNG